MAPASWPWSREVVHEARLFFVTDRDTKRGLLGYPGAPVRHHRELGERPAAGAASAPAVTAASARPGLIMSGAAQAV